MSNDEGFDSSKPHTRHNILASSSEGQSIRSDKSKVGSSNLPSPIRHVQPQIQTNWNSLSTCLDEVIVCIVHTILIHYILYVMCIDISINIYIYI